MPLKKPSSPRRPSLSATRRNGPPIFATNEEKGVWTALKRAGTRFTFKSKLAGGAKEFFGVQPSFITQQVHLFVGLEDVRIRVYEAVNRVATRVVRPHQL